MIYLFLILLTGIISIDRNNALNLMISRPIVISLIFYLFVENSSVIILTGILYELYGVIDIPVGTHIPKMTHLQHIVPLWQLLLVVLIIH